MSEPHRTSAQTAAPPGAQVIPLRPVAPAPTAPPRPRRDGGAGGGGSRRRGDGGAGGGGSRRGGVRVKKLRVLLLLAGIAILATVSTAFGMMMAVASDLPALEEPASHNTILVDRAGRQIGLLTGDQRRILLQDWQIAPVMKHAIIAIEDERFYTNDGVDLRGIARALWADIRNRSAVQGGSTITQQFVKNALAAQDDRSLLNKVHEAALAYHITRKWSKPRILRNYLNTIYFGNGAYGIESAARTYFGRNHPGCDAKGAPRPCAAQLEPQEAALLAGMVASPSGFDPLQHPRAAQRRRDLVLAKMRDDGYLTPDQAARAMATSLPGPADVQPPRENTDFPYFTSWIKQQVVDDLGGGQQGARLAFDGGLTVRTTLDRRLQEAAQQAIAQWLPDPTGPRAALVALDNKTGAVRAMVGGDDYAARPFNLATQGQRQPGSAFKPFVLAQALREGISPSSTWVSSKQVFKVPGSAERFTVNNYEGAYSGVTTLARATAFSDNAVFAQVGIKVGTRKIARLARQMGIRSPVSHNWAITLGGLREGVTPLDLAHAYQTFARGGLFTYGTLSPGAPPPGRAPRVPVPGPAGIELIGRGSGRDAKPLELPDGARAENATRTKRVLPAGVAREVGSLLQGVVQVGTGQRAAIPGVPVAGKTGTTENYGDAWFVGWTPEYTVAVWVGYPDRLRPMKTEFRGEPVAGGTYPAAIWRSFMERLLAVDPLPEEDLAPPAAPTVPSAPGGVARAAPATPAAPATSTAQGAGTTGAGGATEQQGAGRPAAPGTASPPAGAAPDGGAGTGAAPGTGARGGTGTGTAPGTGAGGGTGTGTAPGTGTPGGTGASAGGAGRPAPAGPG